MSRKSIYDRLPSIAATKHYLHAHGWEANGQSDKFTLFRNTIDDEELELVVARDVNVGGWEKSVANTIEILSGFFDQSFDQIISAILSVKFDIFRSHIGGNLVKSDTIDLDTAVEFVNGLRSLMISSAGAELKPQESNKRSPAQAIEYGKKCRFGHTFRGSFGFIVESPVLLDASRSMPPLPELNEIELEIEEPFERKVIRRLARGVNRLNEAVAQEDTSLITQGFMDGLNANMLDDLIFLHNAAKLTQITFDFNWSPELPEREFVTDFNFVLNRRKVEIAEAASFELRKTSKPVVETLTGYVTDLHTDFNLRAQEIFHDDRKVVVKLVDREYFGRKLRIPLNESSYRDALVAHKEGILTIVSGKMEKRGQFWHLLDPDNFRLVKP